MALSAAARSAISRRKLATRSWALLTSSRMRACARRNSRVLSSVRSALAHRDGEKRRHGERAEIEARLAVLSPRERDVLSGLVSGRANKQIAYDLGISPRTVEIYRANLMNKMQAGSLSELVRMALIAGMLEHG